MATELDAAELMLLRAAWMENNHPDYEKESAMAKMYASDVAMRAAIEGVQIFGGYATATERNTPLRGTCAMPRSARSMKVPMKFREWLLRANSWVQDNTG